MDRARSMKVSARREKRRFPGATLLRDLHTESKRCKTSRVFIFFPRVPAGNSKHDVKPRPHIVARACTTAGARRGRDAHYSRTRIVYVKEHPAT